jgi:aspartyl-tRNA synthetase
VDPLTITADQYDLVCNGVELSSGAVRNHDPEIMVKAFELVRLGEEDVKKKFPAMYNAFCYGAPPHAGIAPGIDRMVMLLSGEDSIREVIPFPMNKNAQDVMMGAPSTVEQKAAGRAAHRRCHTAEGADWRSPLCYFCIGQTPASFQPSESMIN